MNDHPPNGHDDLANAAAGALLGQQGGGLLYRADYEKLVAAGAVR